MNILLPVTAKVTRFPLFKNAQGSFIAELAHCHSWEQALPGDLVTDEAHSHGDSMIYCEKNYEKNYEKKKIGEK